MISLNKTKHQYALSLLSLLIFSCSSGKYAATDKVYKKQASGFSRTIKAAPPINQEISALATDQQMWVGSVNFGIRKPNFVILHHTAQDSAAQTLKTFTLARTQVSAHYVIGRDGKIYQMVNDYLRAQHAGVSKWGNDTDLNSSSIGIEIDNNVNEPYPEAQIKSLIEVLTVLKRRYNIPTANFIGHADIAPTRKPDPNKFPWKVLAKKEFGLWYDEVLLMPPPDFDTSAALRIIGYDIKNLPAAITAFKRHFVQTDITPVLTSADQLILFNLYKKYM